MSPEFSPDKPVSTGNELLENIRQILESKRTSKTESEDKNRTTDLARHYMKMMKRHDSI